LLTRKKRKNIIALSFESVSFTFAKKGERTKSKTGAIMRAGAMINQ
jgi:hypothetical protein